jgi:hypothetical protein
MKIAKKVYVTNTPGTISRWFPFDVCRDIDRAFSSQLITKVSSGVFVPIRNPIHHEICYILHDQMREEMT